MRYVAFLRAINVGGHVVKMDALRRMFESAGFTGVETFIASGNVVFEAASKSAPALERKIEAHLEKALGYPVATFLRSMAELDAIARHAPFNGSNPGTPGRVYIAFLKDKPGAETSAKLKSLRNDTDDFHIREREVYWLCRATFSESTFSGSLMEKTLKQQTTIRNTTTVTKLAAKYC